MKMSRIIVAVFLSTVVSIFAINRPVYKIVLTQKGYAQFLQYDVVTPPLREFTICTWIRVYDLAQDQTIFSYVVNGHNRVIRLWLDSGGHHMKISINGKVTSDLSVDIVKDVWRHVCLSYQSDYGAWAVYIDSRLVSCESVASLYGFVFPGDGSVIIGYATGSDGAPNGFEGEIFGTNMILSSTIERNYSLKVDPGSGQKRFPRNKLKHDSKYAEYVVLNDLLNNQIQNNFEKSVSPNGISTKSINNYRPPNIFEQISSTRIPLVKFPSNYEEDASLALSDFGTTNKEKVDFWNNGANTRFTFADVYKAQETKPTSAKLLNSSAKLLPMVSEFETPPPVTQNIYFYKTRESEEPTPKSIYNLTMSNIEKKVYNFHTPELFDYETPPPVEKNTKVYGQWSNSKFAGTVLNYLKSINFKNKEMGLQRVPQTLPLHKVSDSHPYASEFKLNIHRPPFQFKNRKVVEKRYDIIRREPQINLNVLEDDSRLNVLKMHAETWPQNVEIHSHGEKKKHKEHRFYRNADYKTSSMETTKKIDDYQPKSFTLNQEKKNNHRYFVQPTPGKSRTSKLPFLKSLEYLMQGSENSQMHTDIHNQTRRTTNTRSLSLGNKWHNAKSYSNDYTPRKINADYPDTVVNKKHIYPSVRINYVPEKTITKKFNGIDPTILNARKLATEVSNQSYATHVSEPVLKQDHEYIPDHKQLTNSYKNNEPKLIDDSDSKIRAQSKRNMKATNFDQHVKIGNALNERIIIGVNEEQKKKSFVGGNDNIPEINKYRSELDNDNPKLLPSLGPRVCKNVELYDRVLYVQPDESIDLTHILSPVRENNIGIEFVMQNYKKCSLAESNFQKSAMLLIDWSKTPVRLFGGAHPRTTTDLCGFF